MKRICKNIAFTCIMLFGSVSLFGQNLPLIFELTDPLNEPLQAVEVTITSEEGVDTTLVTDELGRFVISSFYPGEYNYTVDYGDYSIGHFSIAPGDPFAWVSLDFRKATISLKDDKGDPLSGEDVSMFKVLPAGSDSLISTKKTGEDGTAEFILLDKEKYSYIALLQKETFTMNGELNKDVSAQSAYALVSTFFGFKIDSKIVNIAAGKVMVYRKNAQGQFTIAHGESPAKPSPDGEPFNLFDSPVSCKPGVEYFAKVQTSKYGELTVEFTPYFNPEMKDTVYFILKEKEDDPGGGGGGGGKKPPFPIEDDDERPTVTVTIKTAWKDTKELIPYTPYMINWFESQTDEDAIDSVRVLKDLICEAGSVFGDDFHSFMAEKDTSITIYYDDFYRVRFTFRLDGEPVSASVRNFNIKSDNGRDEDSSPSSLFLAEEGSYDYSFSINDFHYEGKMSGSFSIPEITQATRGKDTTIYIDIVKKKEVKFLLLDPEDEPLPFFSGEVFKYENGTLTDTKFDMATHTGFITDTAGIFVDYLLEGDYRVAALDTVFDFSIYSDTTIILQRKAEMKHVYFKFLLNGKEVFPQVLQIDLSYADSTNSFYIVSSFKKDEEGTEYTVFDTPAKCLPGEYVYSFELTDMGFNGRKLGSFKTALSAQKDTIIFVVLPIKPEVEITVLDKNLVPIRNVYGTIYKYNEDGTLNPDPVYDDFSHDMLKTDDNGIIWDKLLPGKYRYVMEDIVQRDFVVGEYNIKFQVISGVDYYTTTFVVKDTKGKPVTNTLLEVKQGEDFYGSNLTDENGTMIIENEAGSYSYHLDYGNAEDGSYDIYRSDTTIYIVVQELVHAESIAVKGCQCLQNGDVIQFSPEITPENATFSDVVWSIDNPIYANISSKGILTANEVGLEGTVLVTATAKDGSGIFGTQEVYIKQDCNNAKIELSIGTQGVKDTIIAGGQLSLIAGEIEGETNHPVEWFVYQYSTDKAAWKNIHTDPVQESSFSINAKEYETMDTVYLRVIAAESEKVAQAVAETGETSEVCVSYLISNTVKCKVVDITQNWTSSVCSNDAEVTLNLSETSLALTAKAGTTVEWYKKTNEATGFVKVAVAEDKQLNPTFTLTGKTTFMVRISNETERFSVEFEQAIDYVSVSDFKIAASESEVCVGAPVELLVNNTKFPAGSYKWMDGSDQETFTVSAEQNKEYWAVLKACTKDTAKIVLTVDDSLKVSLKADKELICSTETDKVKLHAEITKGSVSTFAWSPTIADQTATVSVLPKKTTTYRVAAKTALGKCPAATDSVIIAVEAAIELALNTDGYDICQDDTKSIVLSAEAINGTPTAYIWWDGETTTEPARTILPTETATYSVQAKGTACSLSEPAFTDEVRIAIKTPINLLMEAEVVNWGESIKMEALTNHAITGPYAWYMVEEGEEIFLQETGEPVFEHFPEKATTYLVKAENGTCPVIASTHAGIQLADGTEIPTVFTPYDKDGLNDDFMPGYTVFIYDRYGNLICRSEDGWDGTYRGKLADAGVYIYAVTMKDNRVEKGTIEVIRLK